MKWFEDCACLTKAGNCSRDVHTEITKGKCSIVGWQKCLPFHGERKGCPYYYTITDNK